MCRCPTSDMSQKPPKSAYELLMEKKQKDETAIWFIEEHCPECRSPVYTDGKKQWCSKRCKNFGKEVKQHRLRDAQDYMGFISDLIR